MKSTELQRMARRLYRHQVKSSDIAARMQGEGACSGTVEWFRGYSDGIRYCIRQMRKAEKKKKS